MDGITWFLILVPMPATIVWSLYDYVKKHNVEIVALTLPKGPAKKIAQKLVECGVKAFWNFAHTDLSFSDDIIVENVHLSESLMKLTYRISEKNDSKE